MNYYATLDVAIDADEKTIKKAFRKAAQFWHPDRNKDPEAEARFKEINDAAEILLDANRRKHYDDTGEARLPSSTEIEVRNRVMAMVVKGIQDGNPDVVVAAIAHCQAELNRLTGNKQGCKQEIAALRDKRARVKDRADGGMNLFHMVIDQQIANHESNLEKLHTEDDLFVAAFKELKQYESGERKLVIDPGYFKFTSSPFGGTSTTGF